MHGNYWLLVGIHNCTSSLLYAVVWCSKDHLSRWTAIIINFYIVKSSMHLHVLFMILLFCTVTVSISYLKLCYIESFDTPPSLWFTLQLTYFVGFTLLVPLGSQPSSLQITWASLLSASRSHDSLNTSVDDGRCCTCPWHLTNAMNMPHICNNNNNIIIIMVKSLLNYSLVPRL